MDVGPEIVGRLKRFTSKLEERMPRNENGKSDAERRLEVLRAGEEPKDIELRPGVWNEILPTIWVNLQSSDMHGCEIKVDVR
jgi:hypothetical protein